MTTCLTCGAPMPGAPAKWRTLRRYCGVPCRRRMEYRRRQWDRLQGWIRAADMNSAWPGLNAHQQEAHRQRGSELRREAGPRP